MTPRQLAMGDMKAAGLNISLFLYDQWFDGRMFNGGARQKKHTTSPKVTTTKSSNVTKV